MKATKQSSKRDCWSVSAMLNAWGLRVCGPSLKSPLNLSTGGRPGLDHELQALRYVERTQGFDRVRGLLVHVYANGQPAETYRWRQPGDAKLKALLRLGWGEAMDARCPASYMLTQFVNALADRLRTEPFVPVSEPPEEDIAEIVATAGRRA